MTREGYYVEVKSLLLLRAHFSNDQSAEITFKLETPSIVEFDVKLTEDVGDSIGKVDPAIQRALRVLAEDFRALADLAEAMVHDH